MESFYLKIQEEDEYFVNLTKLRKSLDDSRSQREKELRQNLARIKTVRTDAFIHHQSWNEIKSEYEANVFKSALVRKDSQETLHSTSCAFDLPKYVIIKEFMNAGRHKDRS